MRRWSAVVVISLSCGAQAADIGGYFHEARKQESQAQCGQWIAAAQRASEAELHYRVGLCYWNGWGVPEDAVAAAAWLRRAAERGHHDAQLSLGDLVRFDDMREAYRWYAIAAESNHPGAQVRRDRLGRLLDAADRDAIQREIQLQRRDK
jgi:hypothetical protein